MPPFGNNSLMLVWGSPREPTTRFFFCLKIAGFLITGHPFCREEGSVIYSYKCFWALPEQSLSCPTPSERTSIFYCLISDSPSLEGQVPVFISPWNKMAQLYPRVPSSLFVDSYDSQGLRWRYSNPPPRGSLKTKFLPSHI
jgi:hypothetical protein